MRAGPPSVPERRGRRGFAQTASVCPFPSGHPAPSANGRSHARSGNHTKQTEREPTKTRPVRGRTGRSPRFHSEGQRRVTVKGGVGRWVVRREDGTSGSPRRRRGASTTGRSAARTRVGPGQAPWTAAAALVPGRWMGLLVLRGCRPTRDDPQRRRRQPQVTDSAGRATNARRCRRGCAPRAVGPHTALPPNRPQPALTWPRMAVVAHNGTRRGCQRHCPPRRRGRCPFGLRPQPFSFRRTPSVPGSDAPSHGLPLADERATIAEAVEAALVRSS